MTDKTVPAFSEELGHKARIAEEAQHFFEWPDPKHRDTVTLTSCVIFASVIAEMARAAERERWVKWVHAMHRADDACGAGFYQDSEWIAAYDELRRMAGMGERA